MATALMAWLSAPAPTTCTSTDPDCRTTPAIAPATEFGFDLLDTLRISIVAPNPSMGVCLCDSTLCPFLLPDGTVDFGGRQPFGPPATVRQPTGRSARR